MCVRVRSEQGRPAADDGNDKQGGNQHAKEVRSTERTSHQIVEMMGRGQPGAAGETEEDKAINHVYLGIFHGLRGLLKDCQAALDSDLLPEGIEDWEWDGLEQDLQGLVYNLKTSKAFFECMLLSDLQFAEDCECEDCRGHAKDVALFRKNRKRT
jgi:hypothetical protein